MTDTLPAFALPGTLPPALAEVRSYWEGLVRGKASNMPYWDDVNLSDIAAGTSSLILVGVFEKPERFRFDIVGDTISTRYGGELQGRFADEIDIRKPFEFFRAQASVTVEGRGPTFYAGADYSRLVLPLWGEGHVGMLLCAVSDI